MNEQWFLLGDIHGSAQPVHYFYQKNKERLSLDSSENYMILLGDVGANFALTGQRDHKFKSELSKLPFTFICLRGNHEARVKTVIDKNPDSWETISKYDGSIFVEKEFPHIEYLADGPAVYNFKSYKTLSLPGAYSVDKYYRQARHLTWYKDEQLNEKEMELGRASLLQVETLKAWTVRSQDLVRSMRFSRFMQPIQKQPSNLLGISQQQHLQTVMSLQMEPTLQNSTLTAACFM